MLKTLTKTISYLFFAVVVLTIAGCEGHPSILNPKGLVAFEQRKLFFDTAALMLIVVIPVILMSFDFVTHYRDTNHTKKTEYSPDWAHNTFLELVWWGVPCAIILILGVITWISTHKLDPYRRLNYPGEVMQVEVVALPWKWLFIYPEENIATVNYLALPEDKQVEFTLTTDNVPMSAFMIPQLGSQIYTMAGMKTKLHLIANHTGTIKGMNTQYNGDGFAGMHFDVDVLVQKDYDKWVSKTRNMSKKVLNTRSYRTLRQASENVSPQLFAGVDANLFETIVQSYKTAQHPSWKTGSEHYVEKSLIG